MNEPAHRARVALNRNTDDAGQHRSDELLTVLSDLEVRNAQVEYLRLTFLSDVEDQRTHRDPPAGESQLLCVEHPSFRGAAALVPFIDRPLQRPGQR